MKKYIGVDLGGTHVRAAIVDEQGAILEIKKTTSEPDKGPEHVVSKIITLIESLSQFDTCLGIGLGVPGPIDTINGKIIVSTNLPKLIGYPIADMLTKYFEIPVFMDNDGNLAALGEAVLGAGKDYPIVYYVTISTGIGGALVVDKKVLSGQCGHAGEVGNIIIDRNRKKYNILNAGAAENETSGPALVRKGKEWISHEINSPEELFALARNSNKIALKIIDDFAYDLAIMFSSIAHVCDPHVFIVGGGLMNGKDVFFDKMERYYRELIHVGMQSVVFKSSQLEESGIVGAAMLPMTKMIIE